MQEEVLIELGLNRNEARVYLSLLDIGPSIISRISDHSKIHRSNVYEIITKLSDKGLVSSIVKDDEKIYEAAHPSNLMNLIKEKEIILNNILPELELKHKLAESKSEVKIYEGLASARNAMEHMLAKGAPIDVFGVSSKAPSLIGPFLENFHRRRVEKGIHFRHIYNTDCSERAEFLNGLTHTETRFLPKEYDVEVATNICGDEVIIIQWEKDAVVLHIRNKKIADAYQKYFDLMWGIAKEF